MPSPIISKGFFFGYTIEEKIIRRDIIRLPEKSGGKIGDLRLAIVVGKNFILFDLPIMPIIMRIVFEKAGSSVIGKTSIYKPLKLWALNDKST